MASSDFGRTLSVGAIRFEDRFCASKQGGIGGGGRVSVQGTVLSFMTQTGVDKAPLPL